MYDYYDYGYDIGNTVGSVLTGLLVFLVFIAIIALAVSIVTLIAQWKLYKKAGKGGWEVIVPFYCNWVLVEIAGLKWYWFLGFFGPLVLGSIPGLGFLGWLAYLFTLFNIFYNISKRCNKGIGFAVCATLFTPICIMILGFSKKIVYDKNIPVSEHGVFGEPNTSKEKESEQPEPKTVVEQPAEVNSTSPTQAFCANCGSPLNSNAKFCTYCGTKI